MDIIWVARWNGHEILITKHMWKILLEQKKTKIAKVPFFRDTLYFELINPKKCLENLEWKMNWIWKHNWVILVILLFLISHFSSQLYFTYNATRMSNVEKFQRSPLLLTLFSAGGGAHMPPLSRICIRVCVVYVPIFFWQFFIFSVEKSATLFSQKNHHLARKIQSWSILLHLHKGRSLRTS